MSCDCGCAPWLLIGLDLLMVVASLIWLVLSCLPSSNSWALTPSAPSPLTQPRDAPFPLSIPILPLLAILFVASTLLVIFYLVTYIIRFLRREWDGWEQEQHGMVHAIHTKYIQYQHSLTCECVLSWTLLIITLGWLLTSGFGMFLLLFLLNDIDDMPHDFYNTRPQRELYKTVLHITYYHITTLSLGIFWCLIHVMYGAYRLHGLHTDMEENKERYDFILRQHQVEPAPAPAIPLAASTAALFRPPSPARDRDAKSCVPHDRIMSLPSFQYHEIKQPAVFTQAPRASKPPAPAQALAPSDDIHISSSPSSLTPHQWHRQKHGFPITPDALVEAKDEIPPSPSPASILPSSSSPSSSPSCCICLSAFVSGQLLSYLPCDHFMHSSCIQQWLMQQNSCPICRQPAV